MKPKGALPHAGRRVQGCRGNSRLDDPSLSFPARWPSRAFLQKHGLTLQTARVAASARRVDYSVATTHSWDIRARVPRRVMPPQSHPGFLSARMGEEARRRHAYPHPPPSNRCANTGGRAWQARGARYKWELEQWLRGGSRSRQPCLGGGPASFLRGSPDIQDVGATGLELGSSLKPFTGICTSSPTLAEQRSHHDTREEKA